MTEPNDLTIKLFGKTIPLPVKSPKAVVAATISNIYATCDDACNHNNSYKKDIVTDKTIDAEHELGDRKEDRSKQDGTAPLVASEEFMNLEVTYGPSDKRDALSIENESTGLETCKTDEDRNETSNPEEKTSKKLNKVLPCPRCNSMDTKFCYYNNYNVSQPRHFCKNCQRYWTAGGTMRNVPVGAGRRRSKNSSSHYRHVIVSEPLRNACDDETMCNTTQNRFHKPEELNIHVSYRGGKNGVEHLNGSSIATSNDEVYKAGSQDQMMQNCRSFPPHMPCFPGFFLPYSWNSARWSSPLPPPTFCPPSFSMPFYPTAPYWGCALPTSWNVPWLPQPSSEMQTAPSSGSNSPSLGKHSRDEGMGKPCSIGEDEPVNENNAERCLWISKTLRIDDPGEASRSSIWVTSGSKNDKLDSIGDERLFKGFQSKGDKRNQVLETSPILQANPAALSRSINFQESS
ncbi:hypothetical protein Golax_011454 [Gossypium laxum]|uniref:Dof-type domain-containing protein n=1 Tax=Gossypium laxum TaxID=34288 RepID=A0A7J8ZKG6_9ROSI|nr:hypothetical protein [Gossypium laxum]